MRLMLIADVLRFTQAIYVVVIGVCGVELLVALIDGRSFVLIGRHFEIVNRILRDDVRFVFCDIVVFVNVVHVRVIATIIVIAVAG